ncbi:PDZ domain-containing protein [Rhodococcus triatomae]|uniref:Serine protease, S1-C subfamily, contains C-terminal PDZ domain n=1 Tax=Rhodococcus triatomae TaxID=300028 RepID=A0A1G8I1M8_9NOCA|nr:trypsin-like peptidase domain-containing protein [Rhodococcus triatomae]QNG20930.1 PDZ domain-containing protein [Rhodococcus triatomae]QNG23155.1 PDZ domain-containing protein [Rhodococcus triatomae]SDI12783.1 serine protease, S1-C subfamily, contains C-terminal PDZ domain [Rhodococcus triatomae]
MRMPRSLTLLLAAVASAAALVATAPPLTDTTGPVAPIGRPVAPPAPPPPPSPAEVEARTAAVIVAIDTDAGSYRTAGTGIVLTEDGIVLSNHHVIVRGTSVSAIHQGNGATYPVEILGYDSSRDISVLRLSGASGLTPAPIAPPDGVVSVGDPVLAVGNAEGEGVPAATRGTVTALDRAITARRTTDGSTNRLQGLLEFDGPVRPGDSGGPLVDAEGRVIGVNTAGNAETDPTKPPPEVPRSYAVPIHDALRIVDQVRAGDASESVQVGPTPLLGVSVVDHPDGAEVMWVTRGTPADGVGLGIGDVVTVFDGVPVGRSRDMIARMRLLGPGDEVELVWTDESGARRTGTVVLDAGPPN